MKLLLIDGNSMLFRGYYATAYGRPMTSADGTPTNAVFAFANMLWKAIDLIKPTHCAVAFDKGKHTFRHEVAADYKAGRQPTPEDLIPQFALVREYLKETKILYLEFDDIEADDIVGTLSKSYPGVDTDILTGDRDMLQLIDDSTTVYRMVKGITEMERMDEAALKEKYGLTPMQVIDLKGLMGDPSDNIKGVRGIGPKTAEKLLASYGSCEGVYEHLDELKGKVKENLIADKESCFLSKQLATIKTDVEIEQKLDDLVFRPDINGMNDFYTRYNMRSLLRTATKKPEPALAAERVSKISKELRNDPFVYFDSDQFRYYGRKLYGLAFSDGKKAEYISLEDLLKDEETLAFLASSEKKITYDSKACMHCAADNGFVLKDADDLMLTGFLINNYNNTLPVLAAYFGREVPPQPAELYGSEKKPLEPSLEEQCKAACQNAALGKDLYIRSEKELQEKELVHLYEEIEKPLSEVLFAMEQEGIRCEVSILDEIAKETKQKMDEAAEAVYELAGKPFNLNSPKQLAEVLFDDLRLPGGKKRSTSAEVLEYLSAIHPIAAEILNYRKQSKLYSTYAEGLKKYIAADGKIHTIFSQTITQTGRLSSYDPNLQNISVRDEEGRTVRKAFLPKEGNVLLDSDYSQIELRVLASLANEEKMIEAFRSHIDIHASTARNVFGLSAEEVTPEMRRRAKAVNFGIVYGISDFGLAKQVGISRKEAQEFIENYYATYPRIREYMDGVVSYCEEHGYVKTMMNRRRYIREIKDSNYMTREAGKRAAMNSPIQGSAADLMMIAMIRCYRLMQEKGVKAKMILQIHDELLFDVPEEEVEVMKEIVQEVMLGAMDLKTGLESSLGIARDWYEAK